MQCHCRLLLMLDNNCTLIIQILMVRHISSSTGSIQTWHITNNHSKKLNIKSRNAKQGSQDLNSLSVKKGPHMKGDNNAERQRLSIMSMEGTSIVKETLPKHAMILLWEAAIPPNMAIHHSETDRTSHLMMKREALTECLSRKLKEAKTTMKNNEISKLIQKSKD